MNHSGGTWQARLHMATDMIGRQQWTEAERLLKETVMQTPEVGRVHSLLSMVFAATNRLDLAEEEANHAVALDPDDYFTHLMLARILGTRNRFAEAEREFLNAIGMCPTEPLVHGEYAGFLLGRKRWREALESANRALALEPENDDALQTRSLALSMLGKQDESHDAIDASLRRNPNDSRAHATLGWSLLHENRPKEALPHFREALRLEPNSEWARLGILEAMRARFLPYRLLLMYFMWISRVQARYAMGLIFGLYIGYVALSRVQAANPNWSWLISPVLIGYVAFALSTWVAHPLMNAVLLLDPFGRLALTPEEKRVSYVVLGTVVAAVSMLLAGILIPAEAFLSLALFTAVTIPLTSNFYHCDPGIPRVLLLVVLGVLVATGLAFTIPPFLIVDLEWRPIPIIQLVLVLAFKTASSFAWIVVIGSQFAVNFLTSWTPRR